MKYNYEESMKEAMKVRRGVSKEINQEILKQVGREKYITYFSVRKFATCAAIVAIFLMGTMGVSYAAGGKPIRVLLDYFSHRDESVIEKVEVDGTEPKTIEHKLTLNEYYLDALGNGEMTFSLMKKDGTRQLNTTYSMKAYYIKNEAKVEFKNYGIHPVFSESKQYLDGVRLSFVGSEFKGEEIVIEIGRESFTFAGIEVTQPHYLEWKTEKGNVYLSGVGMLAEDNTDVERYISNLIGTPEDTEGIATVFYKDGKQVPLQLLLFSGNDKETSKDAVIQFSPYTQLQKHLEEGQKWEELEEEWNYNFSTYTFTLDEISKLQIGDITLDVDTAQYH